MGAINFFTSDYITLAIKPYDYSDFENDPCFMEYAQEQAEKYGSSIPVEIETEIECNYEEDRANIDYLLDKYDFYYFHVAVKPGYYESFSLDIEYNFPVALECWQDKRDAQKEITQLKQFLIECAGCGMVETWPGWCTTYKSYSETIKAINRAVKDMRDTVRNTPTWAQYERACASA